MDLKWERTMELQILLRQSILTRYVLTRRLLFPIGHCGIIQICGDQFSWIWIFLLIRRDYFLWMRVFSHAVKN